jgi:hypothetical protein
MSNTTPITKVVFKTAACGLSVNTDSIPKNDLRRPGTNKQLATTFTRVNNAMTKKRMRIP